VQYDEVVGRARLASQGEAVAAIRSTLETLAERLSGREAEHLAAQLPSELAVFAQTPAAGSGESFDLDEFFQRVSARENVRLPEAVHHARVVAEVLQEAISPGEIEDVRAQLPDEFDRLFTAGSEGAMPRRSRGRRPKAGRRSARGQGEHRR
jgi:uncharacterized protein (DUF2267 family)